MRKIFAVTVLFFTFSLTVFAKETDCTYLAKLVANEMKNQPFIVKVAYCEMIVNCMESEFYPDTLPSVANAKGMKKGRKNPCESDMYAAMVALCGFDFFDGVYNVKRWREVKNTPLVNTGGVRLYDWYFYG